MPGVALEWDGKFGGEVARNELTHSGPRKEAPWCDEAKQRISQILAIFISIIGWSALYVIDGPAPTKPADDGDAKLLAVLHVTLQPRNLIPPNHHTRTVLPQKEYHICIPPLIEQTIIYDL